MISAKPKNEPQRPAEEAIGGAELHQAVLQPHAQYSAHAHRQGFYAVAGGADQQHQAGKQHSGGHQQQAVLIKAAEQQPAHPGAQQAQHCAHNGIGGVMDAEIDPGEHDQQDDRDAADFDPELAAIDKRRRCCRRFAVAAGEDQEEERCSVSTSRPFTLT